MEVPECCYGCVRISCIWRGSAQLGSEVNSVVMKEYVKHGLAEIREYTPGKQERKP